jgi:hypothetical protein
LHSQLSHQPLRFWLTKEVLKRLLEEVSFP